MGLSAALLALCLLAAFAVLLLWLAGPRAVQETRETLSDIGLLVLDKSASMQIGDRAAGVTPADRLLDPVTHGREAQPGQVPGIAGSPDRLDRPYSLTREGVS